MFIFVAVYILHSGIDKRVSHEIEKIIATLEVNESTITITDFREINEPDFTTLSEESMFLQIYDLSGNILISSENLGDFLPIPPELNFSEYDFAFGDLNVGDDRLRMGVLPIYNENGEVTAIIQIATFENELRIIRNRMIIFNLILLPLIMLLVVAASLFLAKKSFKPINSIIETAKQISAKRLATRIDNDAKPEDELGRLRDTLNGLFDRIESYVNQLSQFTDHASHQLMNPLTALKTELEYILKRKNRTNEEYRETLNRLLAQSDQMIKIVKTLLVISKHEKGEKGDQRVFNLSKIIKDKIQPEFSMFDIKYTVEDDIYLRGDSEKFFIVFTNLIDNAVKYSKNNDVIEVSLSKQDNLAEFKVIDRGIGISEEDKERVFNRFFRTETSERFGIKGYGLGLSLVKTIVEESGGRISIDENIPKGTIVKVKLPVVNLE
jgi:signal transduction histidine kinase